MNYVQEKAHIIILAHPCPPDNCENVFGEYDIMLQVSVRKDADMGAMAEPVRLLLSSKKDLPIKTLTKERYLEICDAIVCIASTRCTAQPSKK